MLELVDLSVELPEERLPLTPPSLLLALLEPLLLLPLPNLLPPLPLLGCRLLLVQLLARTRCILQCTLRCTRQSRGRRGRWRQLLSLQPRRLVMRDHVGRLVLCAEADFVVPLLPVTCHCLAPRSLALVVSTKLKAFVHTRLFVLLALASVKHLIPKSVRSTHLTPNSLARPPQFVIARAYWTRGSSSGCRGGLKIISLRHLAYRRSLRPRGGCGGPRARIGGIMNPDYGTPDDAALLSNLVRLHQHSLHRHSLCGRLLLSRKGLWRRCPWGSKAALVLVSGEQLSPSLLLPSARHSRGGAAVLALGTFQSAL